MGKLRLYYLMVFCALLVGLQARASHIVGGEVTYKPLSTAGGYTTYQVTLVIYEDCETGQPAAIAEDNPAFLAVYRLDSPRYSLAAFDTSIFYDKQLSLNVPVNFTNQCVTNIPKVCLLKKTFITTFTLPDAVGYVVSYQRCCRNGSVSNIKSPSDHGATYFCTIPSGSGAHNTSAVFTNFPPQIICVNNPFYYDNSATDADGDSLSYEFCSAVLGASTNDIKPFPSSPPYDSVEYSFGYSSSRPFTAYPPLQINPVTGIITGTPNRLGRYLVTVCCHEWRRGVMINTIRREFQFVITDCSKVVVACIPQFSTDVNTFVVECNSFTVDFVNCSTGGFKYHWDFGVPDRLDDTSDDFQPTFTYPDTGVYTVKLLVNPRSTCPDSITRFVKIFPYFHTSYTDSGVFCPGKPISFFDHSSTTIMPITSWQWNFGDGTIETEQNPVHTFTAGGVYNVTLTSQNIRNCLDTFVTQVVVENFRPFAGRDTIIVKDESLQFNATGGNKFLWSPSTYLNATDISNPLGFFPDTGLYKYTVTVNSSYGCEGKDTIKVWVVNQAAFFVPSAFSPNGDGRNDIFRPVAIGYRTLHYFRVYDRWGENVYFGKSLSEGWDGTINRQPAEIGTYYWQISYVDRNGQDAYMKGDVTLVR